MIELVLDQRRKDLGGFEVGRVLPAAKRRMIGPFAFFDHLGPADFAAGVSQKLDVRPHPHIGLSTITYLFEGEIMHRDSLGSAQAIRAGEINWMTAGRGITHSERFEKARRAGDRLHGIQAWVALPTADEEAAPAFAHHDRDALPSFGEGGAEGRLIIGQACGAVSPVHTHSPMFYAHWTLQAGATCSVPPGYSERAAYVAIGEIEVDGKTVDAGRMVVFSAGDAPLIKASRPAIVMLLGGEPLGERFVEWNFVSSSRERIRQAKADWRAGRFALPPTDHDEFIPLPPDPPPAPEPMS